MNTRILNKNITELLSLLFVDSSVQQFKRFRCPMNVLDVLSDLRLFRDCPEEKGKGRI